MKLCILFLSLSFVSFGFDKIITANDELQTIKLVGSSGMSGSNAHCSSDDDRRDGDRGDDGDDAGTLLVKYTNIDQLKNIKVISIPGRGGSGGSGCNGGSNGSSGYDGDHAVIYLFDVAKGEFSYSIPSVEINSINSSDILKLTKNIYEPKKGARSLFAEGSNMANTYHVYNYKKEKEFNFKNSSGVDLDGLKLKVEYKFKEEVYKAKGKNFFEFDIQKGDLDLVDLKNVVTRNSFSKMELSILKKDSKKYLKIENAIVPLSSESKINYEIQIYKKTWPFGIIALHSVKVPKENVEISNNEILISLDNLKLKHFRELFRRSWIGVEINLSNKYSRFYTSKNSWIKLSKAL